MMAWGYGLLLKLWFEFCTYSEPCNCKVARVDGSGMVQVAVSRLLDMYMRTMEVSIARENQGHKIT